LAQIFSGRQRGGFQYSDGFLKALWQQAELPERATIINFFQLFPSSLLENSGYRLWFYIDQTLSQLFDYYAFGSRLPAHVVDDAKRRERDQYRSAAGIICHSRWAAVDVMSTYGIPAERVHVVFYGANLDRSSLNLWEARQADRYGSGGTRASNGVLRLVFVGKEWKRKGLDRLLRAMAMANRSGAKIELLAIGIDPKDLPSELRRVPGVEWAGFVDKRREAGRFIDMVAACDVGCLLSLAEAGGMSLLEFCRLGLPTIAPLTGGSPEQVVEGATHLVPPDAPDAEIAEVLLRLATDPGLLARQKEVAWRERKAADWDRSVAQIGKIIGRSATHSLAV
jgi:glycosyltransferase involved in cell wall biosynthesis